MDIEGDSVEEVVLLRRGRVIVGGGISENALFRGATGLGTTGLTFGVVGSSVESPFSIEGISGRVVFDTSDEGDIQTGQTLL